MRRLLLLFALATLVVPAIATAVLTPGRTVTNGAEISALSVTSRSVVFAVRRLARRLRPRAALGYRHARALDARQRDAPRVRGGPERRLRHRPGRDDRATRVLGHAHRRELHRLPPLDGHADAQDAPPAGRVVVRFGRPEIARPRARVAGGCGVRRGRHGDVRQRCRRTALPGDARRPGASAHDRYPGPPGVARARGARRRQGRAPLEDRVRHTNRRRTPRSPSGR